MCKSNSEILDEIDQVPLHLVHVSETFVGIVTSICMNNEAEVFRLGYELIYCYIRSNLYKLVDYRFIYSCCCCYSIQPR